MLPFVVCLSFLLLAFGFCVWFLVKDRNFWRNEYQSRNREAKEREQHLFDQMLRIKGMRALSESNVPQPHPAVQRRLDAEEIEIIEDRINERIAAGIMKPSVGHSWIGDLRNGTVTPAQMDRVLWQSSQKDYPGSVADID